MLQIYVYVVVKLNVLFITDVILLNENKVIHNIYLSTFELMYINIWQTRRILEAPIRKGIVTKPSC